MCELRNKIKDQAFKKKTQLDEMEKRRKQMQEKLRQMYHKQQQQSVHQYRNKENSFSSSSMFTPGSNVSKTSDVRVRSFI
jgi:hypothetical protein